MKEKGHQEGQGKDGDGARDTDLPKHRVHGTGGHEGDPHHAHESHEGHDPGHDPEGTAAAEGAACERHADGPPVDGDTLDPDFKYEISQEHGGEGIRSCFQCGSCSAVCVVGVVEPCYDPRKIIRMAVLGMKEEVLRSEFIWLCSACYVCQERCPQGVTITDLVSAIQSIAIREGHIHPLIRSSLDLLEKHGRLIEISEFENTSRGKLGLPEVHERPNDMQKILKSGGVTELVAGKKKKEGRK